MAKVNNEVKPVAIDQADEFDYSVRAAALRLLREKLSGRRS